MRETGAVRKRYKNPGDVKYIPRARTILGQLKNQIGSIPSGWDRQTLEDGTKIFVSTSYGQDLIHIETVPGFDPEEDECENFLESGWAHIPDSNTQLIYMTPEVEALNSAGGDYLDYVNIVEDGLEFKYHKDRPDGGADKEYVDGSASLPADTAGGLRTNSANYPHNGALPGKLKALYQAQIGADEHNKRVLDLISGPNRGAADFGLYSADGFRYWLILIAGGKVWTAELSLTACGEALRTWAAENLSARADRPTASGSLNKTALRVARVEQFIFAEVSGIVTDDFGNEVWNEVLDFGYITGEPFFYGFNFNWLGEEARMITHEKVMDGDTPLHITARRYTLEVRNERSATMTEDGLGNWTPIFNGDSVWTPYTLTPKWIMEWWYPKECAYALAGWGNGSVDAEIPVYETYADDGEVLIATHVRETVPGVGNRFDYRNAWLVSKRVCGSSGGGFEVYNGEQVRHGFRAYKGEELLTDHTHMEGNLGLLYRYQATVTHTSGIGPACSQSRQNWHYLCDEPIYPVEPNRCVDQGGDCSGSGSYGINCHCGTVDGFIYAFDISGGSSDIFLLQTFGSCESFWLVSEARKTGTVDHTILDSYGLVGAESLNALNPGTGSPCVWSILDGPYWLETPIHVTAPNNARCPGDFNNNAKIASGPASRYAFKHDIIVPDTLIGGSNVVNIHDEEFTDPPDSIPFYAGYDYLFNPTVCGSNPYPFYGLDIEDRVSALERARFYTGSLKTGSAEWRTNTDIPVSIGQDGIWEGIV